MALWDIINKNLFIEGVKFWRAGEEFYVCSEHKKSKCPCTALVRYFVKKSTDPPVGANDDGEGEVDEGGDAEASIFEEDPRGNSQNNDVVSLSLV